MNDAKQKSLPASGENLINYRTTFANSLSIQRQGDLQHINLLKDSKILQEKTLIAPIKNAENSYNQQSSRANFHQERSYEKMDEIFGKLKISLNSSNSEKECNNKMKIYKDLHTNFKNRLSMQLMNFNLEKFNELFNENYQSKKNVSNSSIFNLRNSETRSDYKYNKNLKNKFNITNSYNKSEDLTEKKNLIARNPAFSLENNKIFEVNHNQTKRDPKGLIYLM